MAIEPILAPKPRYWTPRADLDPETLALATVALLPHQQPPQSEQEYARLLEENLWGLVHNQLLQASMADMRDLLRAVLSYPDEVLEDLEDIAGSRSTEEVADWLTDSLLRERDIQVLLAPLEALYQSPEATLAAELQAEIGEMSESLTLGDLVSQ